MSSLLVQACSKSKNEPGEAIPALELYSGYFFNIIKKSMREELFDEEMDICILSAEHGLIESDTKIEWYDNRMNAERAVELAPRVQTQLRETVSETYDEVIINVGGTYRLALEGISDAVDAKVYYIEGEGIGHKGHILKRVVRGEREPLTEAPI
ncbi:DUF6884 domain-containing protein [Natranaeroarchaeum sulfidigenes]|uniref:DUF6884 domain-containing protein n=1 Tax=Natranaeroarchaeum sulfidigenes TaxID=2784880 RepID=A0A897MV37_9EURY|nr:DUF6884 domain-containing protein [Natranaeroarchaeum sulfidigenes]QSG02809.1 Uncharacterized protein AArcS_1598 [Natranaeroarchaeum sulfidigenes]